MTVRKIALSFPGFLTGVLLVFVTFCQKKPTAPDADNRHFGQQQIIVEKGPGAPRWIMAKPVSATEIEILWAGDSSVDSFDVYRSVDQASTFDTMAQTTDTSAIDRNLISGTLYTYRVRARNERGTSSFSNEAAARTPVKPPVLLEATYTPPDSMLLRWGGVKGAKSYRVLCSRDSAAFAVLRETQDTVWSDYLPALRGTYIFKIEVLDYDFQSQFSDTSFLRINAGWSPVGSGVTPDSAINLSLCIDQGVPFLSFIDFAQGKRASVVAFRNGSWGYLGSPGVSTGRIDFISMDVANGEPWLTYCDYGMSYRAMVARYRNGLWSYVGEDASFGAVDFPVISLANGVPYVAYVDYMNSKNITVVRHNGSAWEMVGRPGFTMARANIPITMGMSGGVPNIGCSSPYGSEDLVYVWRLGAGDWEMLGNGSVSSGSGYSPSMWFSGGCGYVSYADVSRANAITVARSCGSGWETIGDPGMSGASGLSSVCEAGGAVYVAYVESDPSEAGYQVIVKRWNGTRWQSLGCVGTTCGVLFEGNPFPLVPTISIRVFSGVPYVAFTNAQDGAKAAVFRYEVSR